MKGFISEKFVELWNDACKNLPPEERTSQFAATKGKNYDRNEVKLLLVGRAVNGWKLMDENHPTPEKMAEWADDRLYCNAECGSWVEKRGNALYVKGQSYRLGAFWNYAKEIWLRLQPTGYTEDSSSVWLENIAWSNLYKLSPESGNPSDDSKNLQKKICCEMLKEEVRAFRPTHILMMTGWDGWAKNFADCFENCPAAEQRNICRGENKNEVYVEATAKIGDTKVVVLCRPEFREKASYADAAVKAFGN